MRRGSKDLFEDREMGFGDHLEELRFYLLRALAGVVVALIVALIFGKQLVSVVRYPIETALVEHGLSEFVTVDEDITGEEFWTWLNSFRGDSAAGDPSNPEDPAATPPKSKTKSPMEMLQQGPTVEVKISAAELQSALKQVAPEAVNTEVEIAPDKMISLSMSSPDFAIFRKTTLNANRPVTLAVPEAFMTLLKVCLVSGFVFASPWVFWQVWQFVAVGLMPHERKLVYLYGGVSLFLFLTGLFFCFFAVFPFVLTFLLSFNNYLDLQPQIRLSEWITFAITLPIMFGISFQLPLVMVFLERMQIFDIKQFQEQRKVAYLVISIISMLMTPADPTSMLMMMFPLMGLYELGLWMCMLNPTANPFESSQPAA